MQKFEAQMIKANKPPLADAKRSWRNGRYTEIKQIGSGTYGKVFAAKRLQSGEDVALKECVVPFHHQETKRLYRELWILRQMKHENIINLQDAFLFAANRRNRRETLIGLVFEKMDTDLHKTIKSSRVKLSPSHVNWILYQILTGTSFLHSVGIIHRDLKPQNILMNSNCDVKICDFGLSRVRGGTGGTEEDSNMTLAVVTRFYRAPEIMLGWKYGIASDMWSVGCIFAELLLRKRPLFPGNDPWSQLRMCLEVLGKSDEYKEKTERKWQKQFLNIPPQPICKVVDLFKNQTGVSEEALDLLDKMIQWPRDRLSAAEAMRHPLLANCYDVEDESVSKPIENADLEAMFYPNMPKQDMIRLLSNEVVKHTPVA